MSQWEKLLERICSCPKDLRFNEIKTVLERYGYVMSRPGRGGSHCTFRKDGRARITIPQHEPINSAYVELVIEAISSDEEKKQ